MFQMVTMAHPAMTMLLCSIISLSSACSPEHFPESVGFKYTMYTADIVLIGKTLSQTNTSYDVTFQVDCIMKSSNKSGEIGTTITIDGRYYFNSCTTTYLSMGKKYMIALEGKLQNGKYRVQEFNIASSAAYEMDIVKASEVSKLCGFQAPTQPQGQKAEGLCPTSDVTADNCEVAQPMRGAVARMGCERVLLAVAVVLGKLMW